MGDHEGDYDYGMEWDFERDDPVLKFQPKYRLIEIAARSMEVKQLGQYRTFSEALKKTNTSKSDWWEERPERWVSHRNPLLVLYWDD